MNSFENETNKFEFDDVESNGMLPTEDIDGELAEGDFEFPDYGECNGHEHDTSLIKSSLTLGVNKSGYNINVRSGASTSHAKVATMRVGESFCFTGLRSYPPDGYEWHQIEILYPDGSWGSGWYRGMTGVGYWKNNPYGKSGEKQYYIVSQSTALYTPGGQYMTTLDSGDRVYCKDKSSSGNTGSANHDYMLIHGIRWREGHEMSIDGYSVGQDYERISYAYIDTQMKHGASHVKGNW